MKSIQRIISGWLTVCLLVTMLPASVFAAENQETVTQPVVSETEIPEETSIPTVGTTSVPEDNTASTDIPESTTSAMETTEPTVPDETEVLLVSNSASNASTGTCGTDVSWVLDDTGTLTISGSGAVTSYPWSSSRGQITAVVIESGITSICSSAFYNCSALTAVTIADTVTTIGSSAFENCTALTAVTLPASVTPIGSYAFNNCDALTQIVIPEGVTAIGYAAFRNCDLLEKVTVPASVTSVESYVFDNCPKLTTAGPIGGGYNLEFGWTETIPGNTFYGMDSLTEITLPDTLTVISNSQFYGCTALAAINIPASVTSIGDSAFYNCDALVQIVIPEGVTTIGYAAFRSCALLEKVAVPASITNIGSNVFDDCPKLTTAGPIGGGYNLEFGWTETIPGNTFYGMDSLTEITLPDTLTVISNSQFYGCTALAAINIPASVTSIGDSAFYNCDALTQVIIPEGVTTIGYGAFRNCALLEKVVVPASITNIGSNVFDDCPKLTTAGPIGGGYNLEFGWTETIPGNTFYGMDSLTEITLPDTLTVISNSQFYGCTALAAINIPASVTSIGSSAFYNCDALTQVIIPEGVTTIGYGAFRNCALLEKVTVPASVTGMESAVFDDCPKLTTAGPIGGGYNLEFGWTETIPGNTFYAMDMLTKIVLPDTLTAVSNSQFYGCAALAAINIPASVTSIGDSAFYNCKVLPTVAIPASVTSIGSSAFYNCDALTQVIIPEGVTTVGYGAFRNCALLEKVTVPASVTGMESAVFDDCPKLTTAGPIGGGYNLELGWTDVIPGNAFYGMDVLTEVTLPDTLTVISNSQFYGCTALTRVSIPASVSSIGNSAFYNCDALVEIVIPEGVTAIGTSVFQDCAKLQKVTIPTTVTAIEDQAFYNCDALTQIAIPEGVTAIGYAAFRNCALLEKVTVPASVTNTESYIFDNCPKLTTAGPIGGGYHVEFGWTDVIPGNAFYGMDALTEIILPNTLTAISDSQFYGCSALSSITLPASVTSIGSYAFNYCDALTQIVIPEGVSAIGYAAFRNCALLEKVTVPASVTDVESYIFDNCPKLTTAGPIGGGYHVEFGWIDAIPESAFYCMDTLVEITLPNALTVIGTSQFYGCTALTSILLPASVSSIGNYAFYNCKSLTAINIPDSVTSIGSYAFYNCDALTQIVIPEAVTSIGSSAFQDCALLEKVTVSGAANIQSYAFRNCPALTDINISGHATLEPNAFDLSSASGSLGSLSWSVDSSTYVLTIAGSGDMILETDEQGQAQAPWGHLAQLIGEIVLADGITSIDAGAFQGFSRITSVDIPDSVLGVGGNAFADCSSLESVTLGVTLQVLGESVFTGCENLTSITVIAENELRIGTDAIPDSPDLTVTYPEVGSTLGTYLDGNCPNVEQLTWDNTLPARDVVLVLDVSGSMSGSKIENLKTAVDLFLDRAGGVLTNSRVAIVEYESTARLVSGFTWSVDRLKSAVSTLSASGGTDYGNALDQAEDVLQASDNEIRAMIFFTDGEPNDNESNILAKCEELRKNYRIYTVGFSPSYYGEELLKKMAGGPENYYASNDMDSLAAAFKNLAADVGTEVEEEEYYDLTAQRQFVIKASDATYPAVTGFQINVGGTVYTSGLAEDAKVFSETIDVQIPEDYTGDVVISREGYVTYSMPIALVSNYNTVTMHPDNNGEPFVQQLLCQPDSEKQSFRSCFDHVTIQEASLTDSADETQRFYVDINWNRHTAGEVWLQQGNTRLDLTDGEYCDIPVSRTFKPDGGSIYLHFASAEGFSGSTSTNISISPAKNSLPVDLGESMVIPKDDVSKMHIFGDRKLEVDFSEWTEVPISFTVTPDGTISGTIGLRDEDGNALGSTVSAKEKSLRETFKKLEKNKGMSKKKFNDMLKELTEDAVPKNSKFGLEGKVWLVGYFSGKLNENNQLEIKEVDAYLIGEGSVSYTLPFTMPLIHIPAYFQAQLKAAIQGDLTLHQKEGTLMPMPDIKIDSNITLSLGGGVGVEGVLSGGVQGDGTAGLEIMLMDSDENKAYLEAGFSLVGSIIGIKGKWELYHTPKYYFYKDGKFTWTKSKAAEATAMLFTMTPEPAHASVFYSSGKSVISDEIRYSLLKSDTTMFSEPQLVSFDDGTRLVVWRDVVSGRTGVDAYGAYYSYYNGNQWSSPKLVEDDGTNDYGLSMTKVNGEAYILWHDYDIAFGADLEEVDVAAEHVDISIARFDRSSLTVSDHTEFSAGGYDHQPQLNISGSELQLAWKSGTLEEEALYMAVSQNGVTWSEPAAADVSWYTDGSQQIPSDYSGAALMNLGSVKNVTNGDLRAIVYRSEDLSGTQNIFAVYHSEDGWGLPIQLTSFSDGTYVDAFGADMTEDSLELSLNITYANGKSDLAYQEIILGTDLAVIRADYDHFTLTPGKSSVFYARVTNEGPWTEDMLKLRLLDAQGNVLKTQLADGSIASGETVRLEMNYVIPEDGSLNELTLVVLPVHTTDVDESNNQMSLDIHYSDISVEEMQAHVTEEMTLVTARIVNRGSEALPAGSYSLHYGTPDGPVVSSGTIPATISGAVETLTLTLEPLTCGELLYLKVAEYENENLVSNNQGIVTIQGLAPQVKPQITLDREYMTLTVGQTVQLTASCSPDSARDSLVWTVEPIEGDAVITVDATGTVHAAASGSAYVLATVTNGDMEATARCRVDVAAPVQIDGVQLGSTKLTSELYSTDYAKLQIALLLPQNYPVTSDDLLVANSPAAMAALTEDNGISVVNARFVNENLAKWFDLVALDDRNFILVPTEAALKTPGSVKKSYTSAVAVNVRGQEYVTQEQLTLTVKKTQPKLKATVPAFNSFYSQQSRDIRITGATVTGISCDTLPEWLTLTDGVLTLTKDAPQKKASAKITLSVQTTEWAIPAKVTLSVKNSYKAPGLKLSSSKVTLSADAANSCGVSLTLKAKSKKDTLSGLNVTGLSAPKGFTVESFDPVTGSFILKATDGVTPGKISMDVSFGNTANTLSLPLTVKTAAVKLNASTKAVTLNTGGDSAVIRITATPADYLPVSPTIRLLSNDNQDKLSSRELDIRYETGELTVSTTETTPEDAQYTLYISAGGSQETAIKINTVGEDPSMKMKAAGKIDLSFPDRSAAVTITFQNHSGGNVRDIAWSVSESKGKTVLNADVTSWFSLEKTGNSLLVACVEPTSVNVKNTYTLTLQLTLSDGRICQGTVKLPVKQTAVSVKLSSSRITLNNTISDKAVIGVTCPTKGYAFTQPVWQLMDETGKVSAAGALDVQWVDGNLHVAVNNSTKFDTSYKLLVRAAEGAKASTLTVTIPAEKKSAITASLKAKGRLDVVRDGTTLILTPSYGNCSAAVREETLEIYSSADNYAESIKDSFVITRNDQGQFLLTRAKGAELNHKLKYKAELTADFGGVTVKATASFKLKMGSAKLAVKADSLTLFAKDRNSRVDFCFAAKDTALNEAVRVEIKEAKYQNILELYSYGNGQYAIGFKNGNVPKNLKSLTLNVFLDGNETSNANAAIKLKLKLIP